MASKTTNTFNTDVPPSTAKDKWVINLSKQELTHEEKSLLQKGPKFAVTLATIPIKEYISTTIVAALQTGKLNGVDCNGLYHDVNRILKTFNNKPIHTNITKAEHLAFENLRKDKDHIIVTVNKDVALAVMDKAEYISKCEALLHDTSVYQHLSKDTSPTIHKEHIKILQDYKYNKFISEIEYTLLIPHGSNSPASRFDGLPKLTKITCLCIPQFQLVAQQHTTLSNSSLKFLKITVARLHPLFGIVQISSRN